MSTLRDAATGIYLKSRPLPNSPDMRYEPEQQADKGFLLNTAEKISNQVKRGNPIPQDPKAIEGFIDATQTTLTGKGSNDRLHAFETVLDSLAKSDPNSIFVKRVNDVAITGLYETLPHPPASYVGRSKFREADGSYNNHYWPNIGKAGELYARSVQNCTPIPAHELPDPGLVFDVLLKRRYNPADGANIHQGGQSAMTFAFASLVTHSLFRTSLENPMCNDTSSYLDLSPLYGTNEKAQKEVRIVDGYGKLYPDCFSEDRLVHLPPAVSALLVIFNRNHNYIADMLFKINEQDKWKNPKTFYAAGSTIPDPQMAVQDNEIFQTARLINCGHFMTMIFSDYVAGFLGQTRHGQSWHLKPFDPINKPDGTAVERGHGNHVSVEFNLLYRWHATISAHDEKWTEDQLEPIFETRDWESIDMDKFKMKAREFFNQGDPDPKKREFGGMKRGPDGRFNDNELAAILHDATQNPAQRYGARGTPGVLRPIEVATMYSARRWGVGTMNDFRKFLKLKPFATFEEWNSDPVIANAARQLYKHIDKLELYPGIQAEQNLDLTYGSGFMCGYTLMRAILADAISLVRGDRFFTTDYTPANLTAWGFQDCQSDPDNGAWGANLPKLLFRHLPNNYRYNSVYGMFPFHTPVAMKTNLTKLKLADQFDFTRPTPVRDPVAVHTLQAIKTVFNDNARFHVTYKDNMDYLTQQYGFFLVFDDNKRHDADKALCMRALWPTPDSLREFAKFYKETTIQLIHEHSFKYDLPAGTPYEGKYVDIVRNVINITSVRWASDWLTGLSLKNKQNPHGLLTEQEAYDVFMILFMCVFENVAPEHGWLLRSKAKLAGDLVNKSIETGLKQVTPGIMQMFNVATSYLTGQSISQKPCHAFLSRLAASGRPIKDLTACVIGLAVGSSVNYAQACAQVVDFYLDDARKAERAEIAKLAGKQDPQSTELLVGYIKEAQRLSPQFPGLLRQYVGTEPISIEQGNNLEPITVQPGGLVWGSYYDAQTNPIDFPDPLTVKPDRPRGNYAVQGIGFHGCPGVAYAEKTLLEVIRVIFSLKNIRRATGDQGHLSSFDESQFGTKAKLYLDDTGKISAWPGSLMAVYDE